MRSPKEVFSKQHNTHSRSQFQDYDYLDQLSTTEKEWLSTFTDNYYSSSFDKNPAFVRTKDLLELLEEKVIKNPNKWTKHLDLVREHNRKFYQVSKNDNKILNIDLRVLTSVDVFYKKPDGGYSTSKYYKYSDNNVIDATNDLNLKECNDRSNKSQCVLGKFGANSIDNMELIDVSYSICGPEEYLLRIEEEDIMDSLKEKLPTKYKDQIEEYYKKLLR